MDDTYPKRVSDPAADGIPEYADDDSTAWDEVDSPRVADGPDPYPVPPDRDDELIAYGPLLSDDGTTWLGTAVLIRAPDPDASRAILDHACQRGASCGPCGASPRAARANVGMAALIGTSAW